MAKATIGKGVPPVRRAPRERISIASRIPRQIHEALAASAEISGRTISEEVEQRLRDSVTASNVVAELFGSAPDTVELFRVLFQTLDKVRRIARIKDYDEQQTRAALHAAYKLIGDVYFWNGQEVATPKSVIGSMDKPPIASADVPPEAMGYQVADFNLFWNDARALEEFGEGWISDFWSGDGAKRIKLVDRERTGTPLDQLLPGDNRPEPGPGETIGGMGLEHGEAGAPIDSKS